MAMVFGQPDLSITLERFITWVWSAGLYVVIILNMRMAAAWAKERRKDGT
jgi:hypothetical protein